MRLEIVPLHTVSIAGRSNREKNRRVGVVVIRGSLVPLLPLGARAIHLDPAVIAAPAVTTVVDVSGMLIYLLVATSMVGLGF